MASPPPNTAKQLTAGTAVAGVPASKSAFPPFNPETFASQLIWFAIAFGALYVILSRKALPGVAEAIDERRDRIRRDLGAAERLKGETDKALAGYQQALTDAKTNAGGIIKETQSSMSVGIDQERARIEAQVTVKLADAETRIRTMKTRALSQVNDIAVETAAAIVARLGGGDVGADEVRRALQPAPGE